MAVQSYFPFPDRGGPVESSATSANPATFKSTAEGSGVTTDRVTLSKSI